MPVREFANKKALIDYAEQNGLVIVDVRTLRGVRRAMLFPKAVLQAEFELTARCSLTSVSDGGRSGWPRRHLPALGMNSRRSMLRRQEGWDVPKRVPEPEGATGPR
jgi:hypothetical protein